MCGGPLTIAGSRKREQVALEAQLDARRVRRVFEDGLAGLGVVLQSDTAATRQALSQILAEKVPFTPIALPCGTRTYRFEATLALGRMLGITRQNDEDVPEGISTSFCLDVPIVGTVKAVV